MTIRTHDEGASRVRHFAVITTSSALYETSPLQRRLRDLHVAAQHAIAQQRQYASVGKLVLQRSADEA
jgi:hypothetical protein